MKCLKRLMAIFILMLLVLPMAGFAEESFLFRGRYTWGMSLEEVKKLAEEEGLIRNPSSAKTFLAYLDAPVAGIVASALIFSFEENGLSLIDYALAKDLQKSQILYPLFQEQLTLIYGEPALIDSELVITTWELPDTRIVLGSYYSLEFCDLIYTRVKPEPTPSPTPVAPSLSTDGL